MQTNPPIRFVRDEILEFYDRWQKEKNAFKIWNECPLCGSNKISFLFKVWNYEHFECKECELLFLRNEPRPDLLESLYVESRFYIDWMEMVERYGLENNLSFNYQLDVKVWYKSLADAVLKYHKNGKWLDMGGGTGRMMRFVKEYSPQFETFLCESNPIACELAEKFCGVKVIKWDELKKQKDTYNVITLIASLEHIPEVEKYIRNLSENLTSGGVLYFAQPQIPFLSRRFSWSNLADIVPPFHIRFLTRKTCLILEKRLNNGMKLLWTKESGERRFHIGHLIYPEWYRTLDKLPQFNGDMVRRIKTSEPQTALQKTAYNLINACDTILSPITQIFDGKRWLHAMWMKQ